MKIISLSICILITLTLIGQGTKSTDFGISLIPQITQQTIQNVNVIDSDKKIGFGLRGDVFFNLGQLFQMNAGVTYQLIQLYQNDYSVKMACDFHSTSPNISDSWYEDEFSIHYIGIPIELKYKPAKKNLYLTIGVSPNINFSYNRVTISHNCLGSGLEDHEYLNSPKKFLLLANFGLGFEFNLGSNVNVFLEPRIGYSFNRILKELGQQTFAPNDSKLLIWGIRLGMMINKST